MTIPILKAEQFLPLGKPLPRPAAPTPEPVQIKPGIWKNPDGRLETRNPAVDLIVNGGGKPAPKAPETPLPVLPNALGEWIDCGPDMPDIPEGRYQLRHRTTGQISNPGEHNGRTGEWSLRKNVVSHAQMAAWSYRLLPQEAA
jgi:hypothetical protein